MHKYINFDPSFFRRLWLAVCLVCFCGTAFAQRPLHNSRAESGLPRVTHYGPDEYRAPAPNNAIIQSASGIIYVGNQETLLEFDGVNWRQIKGTAQVSVKSLAIDSTGTVYAGAIGDIGYLAPTAVGELAYRSLSHHIPESRRVFGEVRSTVASADAVYFTTFRNIFRWAENQLKVWTTERLFGLSFYVKNTVYVAEKDHGLLQIEGDSLQLVPGAELFSQGDIYMMLPYDSVHILIGSRSMGLYLYDQLSFRSFPTEVDEFLLENNLKCGAVSSAGLGHFVLGTAGGGAVIINRQGQLLQLLNKAAGLRNDFIRQLFCDRQGALWLSHESGIARVETASPLSFFAETSGIRGFAHTVVRHQGTVYAATNHAIFYLDSRPGDSARPQENGGARREPSLPGFVPMAEINRPARALISAGKVLLGATSENIFAIRNRAARTVKTDWAQVISLYRSTLDTNRVYVGLWDGLSILANVEGQWTDAGRVGNISEPVHSIAEAASGILWLVTPFQQVIRVNKIVPDSDVFEAEVNHYGDTHGLSGGRVEVFIVNGRAVFATRGGLLKFDEANQAFVSEQALGPAFADTTRWITYLVEDSQRRVWISANLEDGCEIHLLRRGAEGTYLEENNPTLSLVTSRSFGSWTIHPELHGPVWFGGRDGIVRYDSQIPSDYSSDSPALIRRVLVNGDSLIFGGASSVEKGTSVFPILSHADNMLRIEYAAPGFDHNMANQYAIYLDGFDKNWSKWTIETRKDYTALPPGDFVFRVKARDIYGRHSREGTYTFSILPPWYQTWWAWLFYGLFSAGVFLMLLRIRLRQLHLKTEQLEMLVADRTATVREQAQRLKELDRVKSNFFANISHEFRTPLTLILGPLQDMSARASEENEKIELSLMQRNARRLLQLINQLLDLSRLESGRLLLRASPGDFIGFTKGLVMSFASLAVQKEIRLEFHNSVDPGQLTSMYFDRDKIEKICVNLLTNAFKFTPPGGAVIVNCGLRTLDSGMFVEISVKDTGTGILATELPHIFERFYQADHGRPHAHGGVGIGLALARELVELHHGEIEVKSEPNQGTEFLVRLPAGRAEFSAEEIVEEMPVGEAFDQAGYDKTAAPDVGTVVPTASGQDAPPPAVDAAIMLIVDDHPDVRGYIRRRLASGFHIIEARDGSEGLNAALENIPDIIISDVMMPVMDGYEFCRALKTNERTSHIPVILLTAKAGEEDRLSGLETGADDYLIKPFDAKELTARVHNLIESRRRLRERFRREGILQPRGALTPSAQESFLQKLMQIIEANLAEEEFGVETLSAALHMGRRQLHRKLRDLAGQTPTDFIRLARLQRARQMLDERSGTVSEIAFAVGFNSLSYFAKSFRQEFGATPSEYLKR